MKPSVRLIDPGFSTADGDFPGFDYDEQQYLRFYFLDWREETVLVLFKNVIALRWQAIQELLPDEPSDGTCEILNSEWLQAHQREGVIDIDQQFHHYRLNFNACGSFELICTHYRRENQGVKNPPWQS